MASFVKAVRRKAKARIGLSGPSGSGKSFSALLLAAGLGGRVAVIDTEKGSASLYAGLPGVPAFDVLELEAPYSPERFIEAIRLAADYDVLIIDGITPEWSGVGGCLEINDTLAGAKFRGNSWSAWNETTPRHRRFIDALLAFPGHLIATMRSKTETAQQETNGRKSVVKLGMKAEQRDGVEYEFTAVLDISHGGHFAMASKDRTGLWTDRDPAALTVEDGARLLGWLQGGADALPVAPAAPAVESERYEDGYDAGLSPGYVDGAGDDGEHGMAPEKILDKLRAAALGGMGLLRIVHNELLPEPWFPETWASHSKSLKTGALAAENAVAKPPAKTRKSGEVAA